MAAPMKEVDGGAPDVAAALRQLQELQHENRVLVGRNERRAQTLSDLRSSLAETASSIEREEEYFTNALLRKMTAVGKEKETLKRHLEGEQGRKGQLEARLTQLRQESARLRRVLEKEEAIIANRLERQLQRLAAERDALLAATDAESTTLAQLHRYVDAARQQLLAPPAPPSSSSVNSEPVTDADAADSGTEASRGLLVMDSSVAATPTNRSVQSTPASSPVMRPAAAGPGGVPRRPDTTSPHPPPTPLSFSSYASERSPVASGGTRLSPSGDGIPAAPAARLSSPTTTTTTTGISISSPTATTTTRAGSATASGGRFDDKSMLKALTRELRRLQRLRGEAKERAAAYEQRSRALQEELSVTLGERDAHRRTADGFRSELERCTSQAHELSANSEVLMEWVVDRERLLNPGAAAVTAPHHHLRTSSLCSVASSATASEMTFDSSSNFNVRMSASGSIGGSVAGSFPATSTAAAVAAGLTALSATQLAGASAGGPAPTALAPLLPGAPAGTVLSSPSRRSSRTPSTSVAAAPHVLHGGGAVHGARVVSSTRPHGHQRTDSSSSGTADRRSNSDSRRAPQPR